MSKPIAVIVFLLSAFMAFGQLDSNSVTVSASHYANLQADQIVFAVSVDSGLNLSLDDVVAALAGTGITASNLSSIGPAQQQYPPPPDPAVEWVFALTAPVSKVKDTAALLSNLQQSIAKKNNGLTVSFRIQGTQVSQELAQSQPCVVPDLIADARSQAQKLADAADVYVGNVLALSGSTSTVNGSTNNILPGTYVQAVAPSPYSSCYVTVKFTLLRLR
jgi:uncharacterized protein YggE